MSPTSYRTAPPRVKFNLHRLVGLGRVELPTSRLSGVRSNQLSYRPLVSLAILPQKRATLLKVRVRFDGGRALGPCSFGGFTYTACDLLLCHQFTKNDKSESAEPITEN